MDVKVYNTKGIFTCKSINLTEKSSVSTMKLSVFSKVHIRMEMWTKMLWTFKKSFKIYPKTDMGCTKWVVNTDNSKLSVETSSSNSSSDLNNYYIHRNINIIFCILSECFDD